MFYKGTACSCTCKMYCSNAPLTSMHYNVLQCITMYYNVVQCSTATMYWSIAMYSVCNLPVWEPTQLNILVTTIVIMMVVMTTVVMTMVSMVMAMVLMVMMMVPMVIKMMHKPWVMVMVVTMVIVKMMQVGPFPKINDWACFVIYIYFIDEYCCMGYNIFHLFWQHFEMCTVH